MIQKAKSSNSRPNLSRITDDAHMRLTFMKQKTESDASRNSFNKEEPHDEVLQ